MRPDGVDLLDTGGCPSIKHDQSARLDRAPRTIVLACVLPRGHAAWGDVNHRDAFGVEWTDAQEVKP